MKAYIEERVKEVANYIMDNKATIRKTAKVFGVSKSTIAKDIADRLHLVVPQYKKDIDNIINLNKAERNIRGGKATQQKYRG